MRALSVPAVRTFRWGTFTRRLLVTLTWCVCAVASVTVNVVTGATVSTTWAASRWQWALRLGPALSTAPVRPARAVEVVLGTVAVAAPRRLLVLGPVGPTAV